MTRRILGLSCRSHQRDEEKLEDRIRYLIWKASEANQKKNWLTDELRSKLSRKDWKGCTQLQETIEQVSDAKVALLAEASAMAPEKIAIGNDPTNPGYLSIVYLPRPDLRFHVPREALERFHPAAPAEFFEAC